MMFFFPNGQKQKARFVIIIMINIKVTFIVDHIIERIVDHHHHHNINHFYVDLDLELNRQLFEQAISSRIFYSQHDNNDN